jgi:outer membrane protein assembly factor BamB
LNLKTGKLLWKTKTGKSIVASPLIDGDLVYIGSSEGKFRVLNLKDGNTRWAFNGVVDFVESTPCVDAERVYFGDWGTFFYALDKKTGKFLWRWSNGQSSRLYSPAACLPVVADGKVFIAAPDRYFTALDAVTGKEVWRSNSAKGRESIGISSDRLELYSKTMQDSLVVFDLKGEKAWSLNLKFGYEIGPSPTVEKEGKIYIASDKGVIYVVDREKRQLLWAHKLSNALVNNVVPLGNGEILTTTMDGWVARLKE